MTPESLFNDICDFGAANANPVLVQKYARYFKEGYDAYGINSELVKGKVGEILSTPGINQELILDTSLLMVQSPKYEMTAIAIQLLLGYKKSWTPATFSTVEKWFSLGITNWAHTDYICGELMNLFFKQKLINLESIAAWKTAENKFQRRAAVVSLIKPMKLSTDFTPFFPFIAPMMHDPAREVHQGLGWFLRETWKKQPEPVETFLLKYKETSPRLIFQYATEKMTAEGRERFRRSKN
ncbi:MAG: DNA alkylation repair protein [Bacteroidales bacterium]